jgi:hypothetical protein
MNAVFFHDDRQRQAAMDSKAEVEKKLGQPVNTEVAPLRTFTMAEDYHQKYIIKQHYDLHADMSRIYPLHRNFVDSTAVARLNGYASGHGDKEQLAREIDRLGLTDAGKNALRQMLTRKWNYDRQ